MDCDVRWLDRRLGWRAWAPGVAGSGPVVASASVDVQRAATIALPGLVVLVASMLAVGALAEVLVFDSTFGRMELEWTDWIARHRIGVLDSAATVGSSLTDTWTVIGLAFGASAVLWLTGHRRLACLLPTGLAVELSVFLIVSTMIGRARPDVVALGSVPSTSSFPSGHVAAGVVLYGGLAVITASITAAAVAHSRHEETSTSRAGRRPTVTRTASRVVLSSLYKSTEI